MSATTMTPDLALQQALQSDPRVGMPQQSTRPMGQEATNDDPNRGTPEQNEQMVQLTPEEKEKLLELRRTYKLSWAPNRRSRVKQVLRSFEVLKGNPYVAFDPDGFQWYDPIGQAIQGGANVDDPELYRFNNNIYQMLCLSFIAALSPQIPKVRYMPEDADDEMDIATARRGSTMMAIVERKNNISSLQKQELLHLWTGGCYFSYSRYVIDSDRAGVTQQPVVQPVDTQVLPDRFLCPSCGDVTPADQIGPWTRPMCPDCGSELGEEDFHQSESLPIPQQVGTEEVPNGMVMINIFGLMNVDCAPYAVDLYETPILDLELETDIAAIRGNYPGAWDKLRENVGAAGTPEGDSDRVARIQQTSSAAVRSGYLTNSLITYSRCWIQPWAFNHIDDQKIAQSLKEKFPKGCKLVCAGDSQFLEATPAKLTDEWTWCGTVRGMGLYPFAIGDAALDIQDRINDVANIVHEHMDRTASPTILVDADAVDAEAISGQSMPPGRITPVKRKASLSNKPLSDLIYQPQFHVDNAIYGYGENLIMLAQLVSGVLPQIFGGSDPNVQTFGGQKQQLNTALGRLGLFWDQIREEHAKRAENCVRCFAKNMGDKVRFVERSEDEGFENEYVLLSEMQGSFEAYPESDQGFPSTYAEIRDRLMEMLGEVNNPFVTAFLSDPDNIKVVARYVAPPDIKIPGDEARTKYKRIIGELAKSEPFEVMPEEAAMLGIQVTAPTFLPQTDAGLMLPDPDFDAQNYGLIVDLCIQWGMANWKMRESNPPGYENVRAYLRLAAQKMAEAAAKQAIAAAQVATQNGPPGAAAPPSPGGAPEPAGVPAQ